MSGIYRLFGGSKGGASGEEPDGGTQAAPLIAKPPKKKFGALLSSAASRARATADETDAIRDAYAAGDVRASAAAHAAKAGSYGSADVAAAAGEPAPEEDHGGQGSDYIKSIVFGGLDGIITTFAIIASVQGASQGLNVVLITGMAKLLGDGLAMGLGDAISEGAEQTYIRGERERERWELSNFPQGETAEMIEIYREKGFSEAEARAVIHTMTSKPAYAEYFIDHMMAQELSQLVPADDENPWFDGFVTFCSFMFFGVIPLL
jgi:DNA damage-binding protein 1